MTYTLKYLSDPDKLYTIFFVCVCCPNSQMNYKKITYEVLISS